MKLWKKQSYGIKQSEKRDSEVEEVEILYIE